MIYLCTKQSQLLKSNLYEVIDELDALKMMQDWTLVQFDSETAGRR